MLFLLVTIYTVVKLNECKENISIYKDLHIRPAK